jgi:hypothetical protein
MRREIEVASTLAVALAALSSAGCLLDAEGLRWAPDADPDGAADAASDAAAVGAHDAGVSPCDSGQCGCPEGKTLCSGSCVDTTSDRANCGACRHACPAAEGCSASTCQRYVWTSDTVKDYKSGLVWQRAPSPKTYNGPDARAYCATLRLGGFSSGWRLPTVDELSGIVDFSRQSPSIDIEAFPGTSSEWFWTSTPYSSGSNASWYVDFKLGNSGYFATTYPYWVRCAH